MADLPEGALKATDEPDSPVTDVRRDPEEAIQGATCTLGGYSYAVGTIKCVAHEFWECRANGQWLNTRESCKG